MRANQTAIHKKEDNLFRIYFQTRDSALRNEIVDQYLPYAKVIARKFSGKGVEVDDLYQIASLGLIYSIERFDPRRGIRFTTFATATIVGEIKHYFRDKGSFIRVPRKVYELLCQAKRLPQDEVELDASLIERACQVESHGYVLSLEKEMYDDGNSLFSDFLGSEDDNFLVIENREFVEELFSVLTQEEREFLAQRFFAEKTQTQVAKERGVSKMQISRYEKRLLDKIRLRYEEKERECIRHTDKNTQFGHNRSNSSNAVCPKENQPK